MDIAHAFWPRWYRLIASFDPMIEPVWRRIGIGNVVRVEIVGRRSGQIRALFLGILRVGDRAYLGHPDGACAWTINLDAAGCGVLVWRDGRRDAFTGALLGAGLERDAVIRATFRQHPFPGGVLYWLSRGHVRDIGRYYRLSMSVP